MYIRDSLVLRKAHWSDATAIAGMSRLQIEHGLHWRWTPSRVRRVIRDSETMVLVASVAGVIEGFAIMKFGMDKAHLLLLAVAPQMRRTGIGTALLQWLEKSCDTAGISLIRLELRTSNNDARRFYENAGYQFVGQRAQYYDRREAAVLMAKNTRQDS